MSKINDIIKKENKGYVIYSEKGKRLSKPYKTKEEAEKRLKEIEMFKHMKDSRYYKGYGIEPKGDYYQVWKYNPYGKDEQKGNDFLTEEDAMMYIDNLGSSVSTNLSKKKEKISKPLNNYRVIYIDNDTDETTSQIISAYSEKDAKRRLKNLLGKDIYGYPKEAILIDDSQKGVKNMRKDALEELYIEKKGDPDKLIKESYDEYVKCLTKSEEGKFEYSEELIEFLHKLEELSGMTEREILGMLEEMKERKDIIEDSTFDASKYIYQFPADMTEEDLKTLGDYNLELMGKVGEDGFQPGDIIVKGDLKDLKSYCEKWLGGYELHPDYLYKEKDFDEDVIVQDATPAEGLINVLRSVTVPHDSTFQYGKEKGLILQIQNVGLDRYEEITKYKHVSPKTSSLAWGRIWNKNELIFNEEKPINILKQDMIKFLEGFNPTQTKDTNDEDDSTQLMNLLTKCKDILNRALVEEKTTPEKAELEIRHEKTEDGKDMIIFNGNPDWQGSKLEEEVANEIDEEILKLYATAELKWWDNSAGCYWILED